MSQEHSYVGIDVSKGHLDVAVSAPPQYFSVPRDEEGFSQLVSRLKALSPTLVVLEATGGLEMPAVAAMAAADIPVVVVNPRQVRDFARATGRLAKTDRLDARILAQFGEAVRPTPRSLPDARAQELATLLTRRRSA